MSILFNNSNNDPFQDQNPTTGNSQTASQAEANKNQHLPIEQKEDDFAIFPQWDVIPPNAIINPRIKKKI